jgi:hypothetical protein
MSWLHLSILWFDLGIFGVVDGVKMLADCMITDLGAFTGCIFAVDG